MEIPVIARINVLENPPVISQVFSLQAINEIFQFYNVWTWGALILAFFATFTSLVNRTKLIILRLRTGRSIISQQTLLQTLSSDEDNDSDDDDTYSTSSEVSSDEENESTWESENGEDSRFAGCYSSNDQTQAIKSRQFSWTDRVNGKSVVKSWDGLGLGFGRSSGNLLSLWDLSRNEITNSFSVGKCQFPAVTMPSQSVIVSAGFENSKNVALRIWDTRAGRQIPEIFAEWQPRRRNIGRGSEKTYVSDDGRRVVVRDVRKVGTPLDDVTDSWWDSDAVIVDGSGEVCWNGCGSVVSRYGNAVLSCFNLDKVGRSH